ncbi:MAG: hypothetical protein ABI461_15225 [Polyangiaceae bacterium]
MKHEKSEATMIEGRSDLWHVQLASGDLEAMTLDQLDEAFNGGRIDESTMVLQGGAIKWSRLGEILGEEDGDAVPDVAAPSVAPAAPLASFDSPLETASRQLVVPTPFFVDRASQEPMANSVRPLAYDVASSAHSVGLLSGDDDLDADDLASLKPSKKKLVAIGLAAGLMLVLGGVGISKMSGSPAVEAATTQANVVQAFGAVNAAAQPAAAASPDTSSADSLPGSRLSDDQKRMLAGLDQKLANAQKAKADALAAKAEKKAAHKFKKGKTGLKEGGDPHDPLNASLNKASGKW